jgi:predicted alpha/beta superfamily hydrolase
MEAKSRILAGQLVYHPSFRSEHLDNERTLSVYLPPGYDDRPSQRYPVVYLHDGQNIFDARSAAYGISWDAAKTADRLISQCRLEPVIQVAVAHTKERLSEYAPFPDASANVGEGRIQHYAQFLFEEVKPFVDRTYRTISGREDTAVVGSSMGGLATLALAWRFPHFFRCAGVLSPALWWSRSRILRELEAEEQPWMRTMRIWLDMGNKETGAKVSVPPALQRTRRLVQLFDQAGLLPGRDYYYWEVAGGEHNEASWAARYDKVLLFFFGKHPDQDARPPSGAKAEGVAPGE